MRPPKLHTRFLLPAAIFLGLVVAVTAISVLKIKQPTPLETANARRLENPGFWEFQAIDTMKYSRDPSREFLGKMDVAARLVEQQVANIAQTGATHIGIATPYDEEFEPIMNLWVSAARRHGLLVWFRGNWSGWEKWFGYERITREQHLSKTRAYIETHPDLFENGDIFTPCPECENGGAGDPRLNGDPKGHRQFLIDEHEMMQEAFRSIGKNITINYNSMNGDVARLIMDEPTTKALGGVIAIDHYVRTQEKLVQDARDLAARSKGKVVFGEFGNPIPDIHGVQTPEEQAAWLEKALDLMAREPSIYGLSYWTSVGGSTELWLSDGTAKPGVAVLTKYFTPSVIRGKVVDARNKPIANAKIMSPQRTVFTDTYGEFIIPYTHTEGQLSVEAEKFHPTKQEMSVLASQQEVLVALEQKNPTVLDRVQGIISNWF
ncbi:hypothetical protein KBC79_03085 [Candidatus Woesebacteria bacterium]|nr:hypothetical protein [Candidatus Woesebacteria bacterium]